MRLPARALRLHHCSLPQCWVQQPNQPGYCPIARIKACPALEAAATRSEPAASAPCRRERRNLRTAQHAPTLERPTHLTAPWASRTFSPRVARLCPQSCAPLVVNLRAFVAPADMRLRGPAASLLPALIGISIGGGAAACVGLGVCALRRHERREAGRKGLYTFGSAPGVDDGPAGAELDSEMT